MKTYKVTVSSINTIRWHNEAGKLHREDGPAIEWSNGDESWYLNGSLHREDGPAIAHANGFKSWYLHGNIFSEEEFDKEISKSDCTKQTITIEGRDYILVPK